MARRVFAAFSTALRNSLAHWLPGYLAARLPGCLAVRLPHSMPAWIAEPKSWVKREPAGRSAQTDSIDTGAA